MTLDVADAGTFVMTYRGDVLIRHQAEVIAVPKQAFEIKEGRELIIGEGAKAWFLEPSGARCAVSGTCSERTE